MSSVRPRSDWLLVELEPESEMVRGLARVGPAPIRIAKILKVGPGRRYKDRYVPMEARPGDRFPFFKATTDSKSGRSIAERLPEGQEMVRETDILFVLEEDVEISI